MFEPAGHGEIDRPPTDVCQAVRLDAVARCLRGHARDLDGSAIDSNFCLGANLIDTLKSN